MVMVNRGVDATEGIPGGSATPFGAVAGGRAIQTLPVETNAMSPLDQKLDRTAFSVGDYRDQQREYSDYWRSRTAEERLGAVEFMRHTQFGEQASTKRLQRILEVSQRGEG